MATKEITYSVQARVTDIVSLRPHVKEGRLPEAALLPAAVLLNTKRRLDDVGAGHLVGQVIPWMPKEEQTVKVAVAKHDLDKFGRISGTLGLSDRGVEAAAGAVSFLREVHSDIGPGHSVLDVVASILPQRYVETWAAKRLRVA